MMIQFKEPWVGRQCGQCSDGTLATVEIKINIGHNANATVPACDKHLEQFRNDFENGISEWKYK